MRISKLLVFGLITVAALVGGMDQNTIFQQRLYARHVKWGVRQGSHFWVTSWLPEDEVGVGVYVEALAKEEGRMFLQLPATSYEALIERKDPVDSVIAMPIPENDEYLSRQFNRPRHHKEQTLPWAFLSFDEDGDVDQIHGYATTHGVSYKTILKHLKPDKNAGTLEAVLPWFLEQISKDDPKVPDILDTLPVRF